MALALQRSSDFLEVLKSGSGGFDAHVMRGVEIKAAENGRIVCSMRVPNNLTNRFGTLHGGAIASIVDCVSTLALVSAAGRERPGVSIDLSITYVSSARAEEEIEIESKVLKLGKNIAMMWAEIRRKGDMGVCVSAHHTKYLVSPPPPPPPPPGIVSKM